MNGRLSEMGGRLNSMNSLIADSHNRIDRLMIRLQKFREDLASNNYNEEETNSQHLETEPNNLGTKP